MKRVIWVKALWALFAFREYGLVPPEGLPGVRRRNGEDGEPLYRQDDVMRLLERYAARDTVLTLTRASLGRV